MTTQANVCFTFAAACDAAIEMEIHFYKIFLEATRIVKDKAAKEILQDAAAVSLNVKQELELATLKGGFDEQPREGAVPLMNLTQSLRCCCLHQIGAGASNRKALANAIQLSNDSLGFYRGMTDQCSGAPMAKLFRALGDDQTRSLQQLEDTYEEHFLTEG